MTDIKSLLEMKLHESITIEITSEAGVIKLTIIRVAEGWMYTRKGQPGTFVPEPQQTEQIAVAAPLTYKLNFGMDAAIRQSILESEIASPTLSDERGAVILRNIMVKLNKPAFTMAEVRSAWLNGHFFCDNYIPEPGDAAWTAMVEYFKTTFNIDL